MTVLCVVANLIREPWGGFLYSAQYKWRNGENNRTLTVTLSLILILTLTLFLTLKLTIKALRHLHCAE